MILSEIYAENLEGPEASFRFRPTQGVNRLRLATEQSDLLRTCIRGLFFPLSLPEAESAPLQQHPQAQIGVLFQVAGRMVQVRRGIDAGSAGVYILTEQSVFQNLALGARSVEQTLQNMLGLRSLAAFDLLHLADFFLRPSWPAGPGRSTDHPGPTTSPLPPHRMEPATASHNRETLGDLPRESIPPLIEPATASRNPGESDGVFRADPLSFGLISLDGQEAGTSGPGDHPLDSTVDPLSFGLRDPLAEAGTVDSANPAAAVLSAAAVGGRQADTIDKLKAEYGKSRQIEALNTRINALEGRLAEVVGELKTFADSDQDLQEVRDKLATMPSVDKVSEAELELLESEPARRQQIQKRREALGVRLAAVRKEAPRQVALIKNPIFLLGLAATLACTALSVFSAARLRPVALGNLIGLTGVLIGFLQYLRERGAFKKTEVKLGLLDRQMAEIDDELKQLEQQVGEILHKAGVKASEEVFGALTERRKLAQWERQVIEKRDSVRSQPQYRTLTERRQRLEKDLDELLKDRGKLGECVLSTEQIAQELAYYNVTAADLDTETPVRSAVLSGDQATASPLAGLGAHHRIVEEFGLTREDGIDEDLSELWGRVASRLFGQSVLAPSLHGDGSVGFEGPFPPPWEGMSADERVMCAESLSIALLLRTIGRVKPSPPPFIIRIFPCDGLDAKAVARLLEFYNRLAKHMQICVFE